LTVTLPGRATLHLNHTGATKMMDHFVVRYIPGGMSLYHSGYWLCRLWDLSNGTVHEAPIRRLQKADYK
jgi:hypothetical protein